MWLCKVVKLLVCCVIQCWLEWDSGDTVQFLYSVVYKILGCNLHTPYNYNSLRLWIAHVQHRVLFLLDPSQKCSMKNGEAMLFMNNHNHLQQGANQCTCSIVYTTPLCIQLLKLNSRNDWYFLTIWWMIIRDHLFPLPLFQQFILP